MEIDYRRNPRGNYMVLNHKELNESDSYSLQMVLKNQIPGLLKADQEIMNGQLRLLYDITARKSFDVLMKEEKIRQERFRRLISDLTNCAEKVREYLLDLNKIIFIPECIFLDQGKERFFFCFDPYYKGNYQSDIRALFDQILGNIDYEDPDYVKQVYELHIAVQKDHFRFSDLSEIMSRTDESETVHVRGMFTANRNQDNFSEKSDQMFPHERKNIDQKAGPRLYRQQSETEKSGLGFLEKLRRYLKGKKLREVVADIDNGVFLQKINHKDKPVPVSAERRKEKKLFAEDLFDMPSERLQEAESPDSKTVFLGKKENGNPCLVGIGKQQGSMIEINKYPFYIGKLQEKADCILDSPSVSRLHARISADPSETSTGFLLEDYNSTNGTYINGIRIEPYTKNPVRPGDVIRLADREYILRYDRIRTNNPCNYQENEI